MQCHLRKSFTFLKDSSGIRERLSGVAYADTPLRRHADTVVIFGCGCLKSSRFATIPSAGHIEILITEQDPGIVFILQTVPARDVQRDL
jgi:hypothetical protein